MFTPSPEVGWEEGSEAVIFERGWARLRYSKPHIETEFLRFHHQYSRHLDQVLIAICAIFPMLAFITLKNETFLFVFFSINIALTALILVMEYVVAAVVKHTAKSYLTPERVEQLQAILHEWTITVALISVAFFSGLTSYEASEACVSFARFHKSTTEQERASMCMHSIAPYVLPVIGLGILCARPRVQFMALVPIVHIATKYCTRVIATSIDTTEEVVMKLALDVVLCAILIACHAVMERSHRERFEEYIRAYRSKLIAIRQKGATDMYLKQLLPPVLYDRLLSLEHYEDSGTSVTVFVAAVADMASWVPHTAESQDIVDAVGRVSRLAVDFEELRKVVGLERIRLSGDYFIATSGLIVQTLSHALRATVYAVKLHPVLVRSGVPVRCCLHTGAVRGVVKGERFLRYEISGPAVDVVMRLVSYCPAYEVLVSSATEEVLRDRVILVPSNIVFRHANSNLDDSICSDVTAALLRGLKSHRTKVPCSPADSELSEHPTPDGDVEESPQPGALLSPNSRRVHFEEHVSCADLEGLGIAASAPTPRSAPCRSSFTGGSGSTALDCISSSDTDSQKEIARRVDLERAKLEVVVEWCSNVHFADPEKESEYKTTLSPHQFIVSRGSMAVLILTILIVVWVEFRGIRSGLPLVGVVLLIVALFLNVASIVVMARLSMSIVPTLFGRTIFLVLFIVLLLITVVGASLTWSSLVANDVSFLFITILIISDISLAGAPWRVAAAAAFFFCVVGLGMCLVFTEIILKYSDVGLLAVVFLMMAMTLRWQNILVRQCYQDKKTAELATELEEKEKETLQSAVAGVIPLPILRFALANWNHYSNCGVGVVAFTPKGVVMLLNFLPAAVSSWSAHVDFEDAMGCSLVAASNTSNAEHLIRTFADLSTVKISGDWMVVAGPLPNGSLENAVAEADKLIECVRNHAIGAVVCGSFYAVVTGLAFPSSFFVLGEAVHRAKLLFDSDAKIEGIALSEDFLSVASCASPLAV